RRPTIRVRVPQPCAASTSGGGPPELWRGPPSTCGGSWRSPAGRAATRFRTEANNRRGVIGARGGVAVVGARELPSSFASQVGSVVGLFIERGWGIGSGGARGADTFALQAVVAAGPEVCRCSLVCLPGRSTSALVRSFARQGGRFVPGAGSGVA